MKLENVTLQDLGRAKRVVVDKDNTTHHRRRRQEGRHRGPHQADPRADRGDHLRLRPREAPGAAREAGRRRRGDQGRRGDRGRDEGEEGPRRGRAARDARRGRGGHRARAAAWRSSAPPRALDKLDGAPTRRRFGVNIVRRAIEEPLRWIAKNAGVEGSIVLDKVRERQGRVRLQRGDRGVRGPAEGRHHRPDQGRAHRAAERRLGRRPAAHHRGDGRREAGGEGGGAGACRRRHGRHGWHGRHDVMARPRGVMRCGTRPGRPRPGACFLGGFLTACTPSVASRLLWRWPLIMFDSLGEKLEQLVAKAAGPGTRSPSATSRRRCATSAWRSSRPTSTSPVVRDFVEARPRGRARARRCCAASRPSSTSSSSSTASCIRMLGEQARDARPRRRRRPWSIMLVGLQGAGKTTTAAKLARHLRDERGRRPYLVPADVYRPAAIEQLDDARRASSACRCIRRRAGAEPVDLARAGVAAARAARRRHGDHRHRRSPDRRRRADGRARRACSAAVDAAARPPRRRRDDRSGRRRHARRASTTRLPLDGVILTKIEGDARGGAALSLRAVTGKPILFVGTGEKLDALEAFHPDRDGVAHPRHGRRPVADRAGREGLRPARRPRRSRRSSARTSSTSRTSATSSAR